MCLRGFFIACKEKTWVCAHTISQHSDLITGAELLTGMCGDRVCFFFYLCLQSLTVFALRAREQRKRVKETSVSVFSSCALVLAIMLVALCFTVTSSPIKTLPSYKTIS